MIVQKEITRYSTWFYSKIGEKGAHVTIDFTKEMGSHWSMSISSTVKPTIDEMTEIIIWIRELVGSNVVVISRDDEGKEIFRIGQDDTSEEQIRNIITENVRIG